MASRLPSGGSQRPCPPGPAPRLSTPPYEAIARKAAALTFGGAGSVDTSDSNDQNVALSWSLAVSGPALVRAPLWVSASVIQAFSAVGSVGRLLSWASVRSTATSENGADR